MKTITNLKRGRLNLKPLHPDSVKTSTLWRGGGDWNYCHHPSIAFFAGRYHCIWSLGRLHEDDVSQRVMIAHSKNGLKWTKPKELAGGIMGEKRPLTLTPAGFFIPKTRPKHIVAYFGTWEWSHEYKLIQGRKSGHGEHLDTALWAMTSPDGSRWSKPAWLGVPIVPNHGPQRISSGRLIISGNLMYPWTDHPSGLIGWHIDGICPKDLRPMLVDDSFGFPKIVKASKGRVPWLCEGSFFESGGGHLHMLLRSTTGYLWETVSRDRGHTWTPPKETRFQSESTKFHFGRLPDGRVYCVSNPDSSGVWSEARRTPLVLSVSTDPYERNFSDCYVIDDQNPAQRVPGIHKGLGLSYPHTMVRGGYLYVTYSVHKEDIVVTRVALKNLSA